MRKINRKFYIWSFIALMFITSCNKFKDFGDANENPSDISDPVASAFLTSTLANISSTTLTSGIYVQYFMESQYPGTCYYEDNSASFTGYYSGVLNYLQQIIDLGSSGTTNNMVQVAKILQQYIYLQLTDQWGDLPYTEALQGASNTKPVYDEQETIYEGVISTIRASVDSMDETTISGDITDYDGDVDSWKKLGNSIIMLAAIQMSKVYPSASGYAATAFNAALSSSAGYISSNDENFAITFPSTTFPDPWYTLYYSRQDYGESETLTDLMSSLNDTRQDLFGGASNTAGSTTSSSIGLPYGVTRAEIVSFIATYSGWARILRGDFREATSSIALINAAYITLVRAEAANLGWTSEDVSTLYEDGIQISFDYWGATMPSTYMSQDSVALGSDDDEKIAIQQYIAVYPNGLYAWNIWRKTGYPTLTPSENAANESGDIPRRIKYSTTEATTNPDNYAAAVARLTGGNSDVARIWWDVE
ncbi:MAG: SusD/RagB family nutrient-binding outer membrane lipoprotein [Chitinophagaceae bacterium]